jgi:putative phosphoribosyl transferase
MNEQPFRDRTEAGQLLATQLTAYADRPDVLVLALPRGGVPVAFEVARALHAPLDVMIVRKLGVPGYEELALGAIASGGVRVLNDDVIHMLGIAEEEISQVAAREQREVERRERLYRGDRPASEVGDRTVILVDDGIATGATMRAAVVAVRQRQPARIVIAVPVAAAATCDEFAAEVDELVCVFRPQAFFAVGFWYEQFAQTSDEEVRDLLERVMHEQASKPQQPPTVMSTLAITGPLACGVHRLHRRREGAVVSPGDAGQRREPCVSPVHSRNRGLLRPVHADRHHP